MEDPRHPLDRPAGGVSPELQAAIDQGKFSMPIEQREAFDKGLDEEVYEPTTEEDEAALDRGEWPFDDDPPDPL